MPASGARVDVRADALDESGLGVATTGGRTLHVVDLLPGEHAEIAIDHASQHRPEAWGRIVRRIGEPSLHRVTPVCPAYGSCGGCAWQHLAYPAQLAEKRMRVALALDRALPASVTVSQCRSSPAVFGYRNKGKYVAGTDPNGRLMVGAYAPRTHRVIDTLGCKVVAPIIDEVAAWVRGAADDAGIVAYDEATRAGELRYVIVRESGGDVLVVLVVASGTSNVKLARLADAVGKNLAVRGVVVVTNDRRDGAIVPSGSPVRVLYGHGELIEKLAGASLEVGASEFLQVNRAQATAMYDRVVELAEVNPSTTAIDLYAGLGGIGLSLARAGATVTAVELDRDAIARLTRAATAARLPLTAIAGDAGSVSASLRSADPDVVVVNPPRKGLSEGARALLGALAAPIVIYVSCGPEALGRDLEALAAFGYLADVVEPFDLMPGTAQVETLVRLRRHTRP